MSYARKNIVVGNTGNDTKVLKEKLDYANIFLLGQYLLEKLGKEDRAYIKELVKGNDVYCYLFEDEVVYKGTLLNITLPMDGKIKAYLKKLEGASVRVGRIHLSEEYLYDLTVINKYWKSIFIAEDIDLGDVLINGIYVEGKYSLCDYYLFNEKFDYVSKWVEANKISETQILGDEDYVIGKLEDRLGKQILSIDMVDIKVTDSKMGRVEESLSAVMPDSCPVHSIAWHKGINTKMYWRESCVKGEVDLLLI